MRHHLLFSLALLTLFTSTTLAASSLDPSCFTQIATIPNSSTATIKVLANEDFFATQWDALLATKFLSSGTEKYLEYAVTGNSSGDGNYKNLNDNNTSTNWSFDTQDQKKTITIDLGKVTTPNTIALNFEHRAEKYYPVFSISTDGKKFQDVEENRLRQFPFQYLRIRFESYSRAFELDNISISELNLKEISDSSYLVSPTSNKNIELYTNYSCTPEKLESLYKDFQKAQTNASFSTDVNTKEIRAVFGENPNYTKDFDADGTFNENDNCPYVSNSDQRDTDGDGIGDLCDLDNSTKDPFLVDYDKDGIPDNRDNCRYDFNPNQKDGNADWTGDVCAYDDSDGFMGKYDNCPNISNADQKDVNSNGVGDACEFDKDKDGVFDSVDTCIATPNPDQKDVDGDGIGDVCDNCKLWNPDQRDTDNSGTGDVCEEAEKFARENDTDKDGKLDFEDSCPKVSNPLQEDSDKDGIGDVCDNCIKIQNSDQKDEDKNKIGDVCEDVDKDGIEWYKDNCPTVTNPDQKDSDNNSTGDVCEDSDGDYIIAAEDNCPFIYNTDQRDNDNDKKGNVCDDKDDRYVESNRGFFIGAIIVIALGFIGGIFIMLRKLQK